MSKTPSPGQSLDLVSEGRRRGKRGREEEKAGEGKKVKEEEEQERITVISITPQPMVTSTRPLPAQKKSNLRPARCQTLFPLVRLSYRRNLISTFRPQATAGAAPSSARISGEGGGGGGGGGG